MITILYKLIPLGIIVYFTLFYIRFKLAKPKIINICIAYTFAALSTLGSILIYSENKDSFVFGIILGMIPAVPISIGVEYLLPPIAQFGVIRVAVNIFYFYFGYIVWIMIPHRIDNYLKSRRKN